MATKKQKRERALAKHEAFMEERRLSGLEAQRKDREYRERKAARYAEEALAKKAELDAKVEATREASLAEIPATPTANDDIANKDVDEFFAEILGEEKASV
jgi:hypothetical protein